MHGEIEFLHGAFESYKSQLHQETEDRWKKKENDIQIQHDEEMQKQLHELSMSLKYNIRIIQYDSVF